ncbi:MAG TPA: phosphoribosyltransferase family protein [Coriobacteriia bacterium]
MFADRIDAGRRLGQELAVRGYAGRDDVLVLGVPRGGVEVAVAAAAVLEAPLDVVVVRKIGAPTNPEFAAGAVDPDGRVHANPEAPVPFAYLQHEGEREHREALRRVAEYRGGRPEPELARRTVIIVDDGIATGLTILAAVAWLRAHGASRVVVAVPVASPSAARSITAAVDEFVALEVPPGFYAVGAHYRRFSQLTDAEVKSLLTGGQV